MTLIQTVKTPIIRGVGLQDKACPTCAIGWNVPRLGSADQELSVIDPRNAVSNRGDGGEAGYPAVNRTLLV